MTVAPRDERRHAAGDAPGWHEWWDLDFVDRDIAGVVRLDLYPGAARAWYWAYVLLPDRPGPIVVRDHDVPLPRTTALEVRADGLWAELTCETALEHWTYGLEAFGVALDRPEDGRTGEIGERLAVGFDLEWELLSSPFEPPRGDDAYAQYGHVRGEILVGRARIECDGHGVRRHGWGDEPVVADAAASLAGGDGFAAVAGGGAAQVWTAGSEPRAVPAAEYTVGLHGAGGAIVPVDGGEVALARAGGTVLDESTGRRHPVQGWLRRAGS